MTHDPDTTIGVGNVRLHIRAMLHMWAIVFFLFINN